MGMIKVFGAGDALTTQCGTFAYMAPELTGDRKEYDGQAVDVFAMGMMLFMMMTCRPLQMQPRDQWWSKFIQNPETALAERQIVLDSQAANLIWYMVQEDPLKRYKMSHVRAHPWWDGPRFGPKDVSNHIEFVK